MKFHTLGGRIFRCTLSVCSSRIYDLLKIGNFNFCQDVTNAVREKLNQDIPDGLFVT